MSYACAMSGGREQVNRCHSARPGDGGRCNCPYVAEPPPGEYLSIAANQRVKREDEESTAAIYKEIADRAIAENEVLRAALESARRQIDSLTDERDALISEQVEWER